MDWLINDALPILARIFIVCIFPFSFIDKIINWDNALKQATSSWLPGGPALLILAMIVELFTPPMIVFQILRRHRGVHSRRLLCRHRHHLSRVLDLSALLVATERGLSAYLGFLQEFRAGGRAHLRHV